MTRRANHTITQSVPTPLHPPVVSPSHLRDRLVDKDVANPLHHPLQRQEVQAASPEAGDSGAETDLSCSVLDCVIVPLPLRRRVSGAAFQGLHTVHGLHPGGLGLGTRMFPAHARVLHDADTGFLSYGPITCSPPQRRLCHGASTVRSPLPPATSYGAASPLPRPDSHRQAQHSFQDTHPRRTYERDH